MQTITSLILDLLVQMYQIIGDLGVVILLFTFIVRSLLLPLSLGSLKSQKKIKELQPKIKELEKKHKGTKQELQVKKAELYQKYNANPLAGCLPQIVQLVLLIVLYRVLINFLSHPEVNGLAIDPTFLWLDLSKPDPLYILPVIAGVTQMILSLMISPGAEVKDEIPNNSKNKNIQKANEKEEDMAEMAATMQKQMLFVMPVMTVLFASRFPSGVALYWVATTLFSLVQQWVISGPGGLKSYTQKVFNIIQSKS